MRLDHLLSRETGYGEQLVCLPVGVGVLVVFLCLHVFTTQCGWWVWVRVFGLGIKELYERAHCRVHVQHRVGVRHLVRGGCPHNQPGLLVWVVCGGLFVICIVVASIFVLYCFLCFV